MRETSADIRESSCTTIQGLTPKMHTFHIPVMGTGFSIDTPLRVARYGISSVVSLADDLLIEQMRSFHSEIAEEPYTEITDNDDDYRARRITAYLDLLQRIVQRQVVTLQASPFESGSEITRYFEMLPDGRLRREYAAMLDLTDSAEKTRRQDRLRQLAKPGRIDVNIMTKLDRERTKGERPLPPQFSDAMAALRGYANSSLDSAIVFSAGMNPRLYSYATNFDDFFPAGSGFPRKKIVLKVSDFRSALIQGKFLAKRGLWVSEYRIESGLNCGGHAFATRGHLMGPILDEFRTRKSELGEKLFAIYSEALASAGRMPVDSCPEVRVTAQGGIGTADEDQLLRSHYNLDGTGWATPFMLVPEATNLDDVHLQRLADAGEDDIYLSDSSPLGVRFWSLRTSESERVRRERIDDGHPGSSCPKGYLAFDKEFTSEPICCASRAYQRRKLDQLAEQDLEPEKLDSVKQSVTAKACICHDLAGSVTRKHNIDPKASTFVCCGPNAAGFSKIATLEQMVSHIYGRLSLLTGGERPHMFVRELRLYVDHLHEQIRQTSAGFLDKTPAYFREFKENLLDGIDHYYKVAERVVDDKRNRFLNDLKQLRESLESMINPTPAEADVVA